ncbi:spore coat protein [Papillibacter cinnamivorans]|uniref:Coat F domain-containing protein n=1 Tax=Papillibacter cinnamivorans DSM 12816 TaxID=1122930 RepID=A0A1W1ZAS7_9FIRM|nr:spore coat protein [Papillibacter cinnamivorans]SMC45514.1 Coat F domain-containing protein [Papillibacter cinnamivorans DSM 12816]
MDQMKAMSDQERIDDFLSSQKQICSTYDTFANECVSTSLRDAFLNILNEEHKIQSDLFNAAQSRGWYNPEQAQAQKISQAYQKFSNQQTTA